MKKINFVLALKMQAVVMLAAGKLYKMGYKHIVELEGGFEAWKYYPRYIP
jgi:rhodanese-related sulfurtransferase